MKNLISRIVSPGSRNSLILAAMLAPIIAAGCGVDAGTPQTKVVAPPATHVEPGSNVVYPDNWDQILIARQYDNEKIYGNAHWWIDRTDCGDEQYEPFDADSWNQLTSAINSALKPKPLTPDSAFVCSDLPDEYNFYNGTVTAQMSDGSTRTLFKIVNFQSCTSIPDAGTAAVTIRLLDKFVDTANSYNCAHPPGSTPVPAPGQ
jgi:hypothetical protein